MSEDKIMALPQEERDLVIEEKDLSLVVAEAEKRVEILKKVLGVAIKRTNPKDWLDQNGHPYLSCSGAEKIAPLFGVSMNELHYTKEYVEDDKGRYYLYTGLATFTWRGGSIVAIGTCSSRDKFFAWNSADKTYKQLSDVDEGNIKKAAYSNLMVNGITRVLGIRNLTWEDLSPFGITQQTVSRVEYKDNKTNFSLCSEAQNKLIHAQLNQNRISDEDYKEYLKKKFGITTTRELKREFVDEVLSWIKTFKS